jgi:hypothetical protein
MPSPADVDDITNGGNNRHQVTPKSPVEPDICSLGEQGSRFNRPATGKPPNNFNGFNRRLENSINLQGIADLMVDPVADRQYRTRQNFSGTFLIMAICTWDRPPSPLPPRGRPMRGATGVLLVAPHFVVGFGRQGRTRARREAKKIGGTPR